MQVHFYRPRHRLLSGLMEGYYFLAGSSLKDELCYYTFPNNFSIVSVLEDVQLDMQGNRVTCTPVASPCFQANLTLNYTEPLMIQYLGPVNELTFYFKPMGLHAFLPVAMWYHQTSNFTNFNPFTDFKDAMLRILRTTNRDQQISSLENYWVSKISFDPDPLLIRIVNELEDGRTIAEIASKLQMSRQYLSRLFLQNLGKTPATFRKIHRFRNAVKDNTSYGNLTARSLNHSFYDQSHFIRNFRELTTLAPRSFFDKVDANKDNLWLYV